MHNFLFLMLTCWTWLKQPRNLASKHFFEIWGVFGCNLKSLRQMKRYFWLQIQNALDIIFPKHSLDHRFENKFLEKIQFQKKFFCKLGSVRSNKLLRYNKNIIMATKKYIYDTKRFCGKQPKKSTLSCSSCRSFSCSSCPISSYST